MKMFFAIAALSALLTLAPTANAIMIEVDPGPVGSSASEITMRFGDLNGTPVNGQTLSLDFVFADMKHAELTLGPQFFYAVEVAFNTDSPDALQPNFPDLPSGFLSDETGAPLAFSFTEGVFSASAPPFRFGYTLGFVGVNGIIHHDIHLNVTLLTDPAVRVTSGTLQLRVTDPNGLITIGEWQAVPEPTSLLLLTTGLTALGATTWRRRRTGASHLDGVATGSAT